jgi:hypothetical protein
MFRRPDRIIVPEYAAPKGVSLLAAAELLGEGRRAVAAQLVGLAVRRSLSISPLDATRGKKTGFLLTLRSLEGLGADEMDTMQALFPRGVVGETLEVRPGRNSRLSRRLRRPHEHAVARLVAEGGARRRRWHERVFARASSRDQPVVPLPAAHPTIDHLWGIRDYIALAEKDRLAFLQSPSGALLRQDAGLDAQVLLLNEKLLPYAVLFGLEKDWVRELGVQYDVVANGDLAGLELLGEVALLVTDPYVLEGLLAMSELAAVLIGVGRVAGRVMFFFLKLLN